MRKLFYLVLWLIWLMGTLTIWVSNAAGTITIIDAPWAVWYSGLKFDDGNWHVIMLLDRNLWATSRWINIETEASFWYHFQWWNNYGFVNSWDILLWNTRVPRKPAYENKWYSWNVFITGDSTNNDYWEWNLHYDGLRWWSGDSLSNWWWLSWMTEWNVLDKKANIKKRQWPCPDWYHVPSAWEWNNLLKYRTMANGHDFSVDPFGFVSITGTNKRFAEDLYIPFASRRILAGDRYSEPVSSNSNIYANLWSSSLSGDHARSIQIKRKRWWAVGSLYTEADAGEFYWRIIGQSVRCFYDSYLLPEFEISFYDWDDIVGSKSVREGDFLSEDDMPSVTKSGHSIDYRYLSWDDTTWFDFNNTMITGNIILKPHWKINRYTITFVKWNGEDNYVFTWNYWSGLIPPANPKRAWYTFKGWDQNVPDTIPDYDMTINAVREKSWWNGWSSGWWGSSNGWWVNKTDESTTSWTNTTTSWTDKNDTQWNTQISSWSTQNNNQFTDEFQQAYEFAYNNWITTMPTIWKANMGWKLTRIAMAKMLSQYAINILWKNPDVTKVNKFNDVTDELDEEYNNWVTLAYQLWIMWINMPENNFRPKDEVTRAEFVTALSRMIYWTSDWEYKWTGKYYLNHMAKLMKEWIITKDDPNMKELRGYVMIMLMRSIKW